jgi:uncharacterized membrane protein
MSDVTSPSNSPQKEQGGIGKAWSGDLDAGFLIALQIAAGAVLVFFMMVGIGIVIDSSSGEPGLDLSSNAQNLILTLTGGVLSLLSTIIGRYFGRRSINGR